MRRCTRNKKRWLKMAVFLIPFLPGTVSAHHALEYLDIESYEVGKPKEATFYLRHDYFVDDKSDSSLDHWEVTPGISYTPFKRVLLDIHIHFSKFGVGHTNGLKTSPFFEAFAPSVIVQLTPPNRFPVDIAVFLGYEYPFKRARDLIGGTHTFEGKLILSKTFGLHSNITLNAGSAVDENGDYEILWMLGAKTPLTSQAHGIAVGVEIEGTHIPEDGEHEFLLLPGIYIPILQNVQVKVGFGAGFTKNEKTNWTERTAVQFMYTF